MSHFTTLGRFLRSVAALPLLALGLCATAAAQTQWVVDAAGDGDFTDLQLAIDTANPGDVLLVLPGTYGNAVLNKRMRILGKPSGPRPLLFNLVVESASAFTLSHFEVRRMQVIDVSARSIIDGCKIGSTCWPSPNFATLMVRSAQDLIVSRTSVNGGVSGSWQGCPAVRVQDSRIQVIDSDFRGASPVSPWEGTVGGTALLLQEGTRAWVVGSQIRGGNGTAVWDMGSSGQGGHGIRVESSAEVDVRGSTQHQVVAGVELGTQGGVGFNGAAIFCVSQPGTVLVSGATLVGGVSPCAQTQSAFAPYLIPAGADGPGLVRQARLFGEAGATAVLLSSLASGWFESPAELDTPLWIQPAALLQALPTPLLGPSNPAVFSWIQPPSIALAGITLHLQGFQLLPGGGFRGTNAAALVLTW